MSKEPDGGHFSLLTQRLGLRQADLAVILLVLILSVFPLLWFSRNWIVTIDGSLYLLLGSNLISGESYTLLGSFVSIRGPVLPGILGGLTLVFGRDVESLAWVMRILGLVNPVLMYFLIKRISGSIVGMFAAAVITLCGYTAMSWVAFNIDTFQLTIYLLAVLALLTGAQRNGARWMFLAGLLFGVAVLVKETTVAALPLALFAALLFGSSLRGVLLHYAGVAAVCLPWWLWMWAVSGQVFLVGRLPTGLTAPAAIALALVVLAIVGAYKLGIVARLLANERRRRAAGWSVVLASAAVLSFLLVSVSGGVPGYKVPLTTYLTQTLLQPPTPLWYLLPFAGAYVVWETLRGNRLWEFYLALLVLQVPVSLLVMIERFVARQYLIPQTLLYGALAGLVVAALRTLLLTERRNPRRLAALAAAAVLVVVLAQAAVAQGRYLLSDDMKLRDYSSVAPVYHNDDNPAVYDMQAYIAENVPEGERIATTLHNGFISAYLDEMRHEWTRLEVGCFTKSLDDPSRPRYCLPAEGGERALPDLKVWSTPTGGCNETDLSLAPLLRETQRSGADYVLATQQNLFSSPSGLAWASYLNESGAFEIVHSSFGSGDPIEEQRYGLVLLKATGQEPRPAPTRMYAGDVNELIGCQRASQGERYAESIRSDFPHGIQVTGPAAEIEAVRPAVERIFGEER